jgi:RimJ/RimL family protein N-acetyltransferase
VICKLDESEFHTARPLFNQPQLGFVIDAVIAGNSNGEIWVDDRLHPRAAYLWDNGSRHYLAGLDDNQAFKVELAGVVADHASSPYLVAYCTSDACCSELSAIFAGRQFTKRQRCLYRLDRLVNPDWREHLMSGFSIARIDKQLLEDLELANLNSLIEEISSMWPSIDMFLERAFGFVALHDKNKVVCWCTAEYISDNRLGIGIETVREYERQGLATLTASAFAEYCLSNSLETHWDSWSDNTPSIRVAEKVGFEKVLDYYVCQGQ